MLQLSLASVRLEEIVVWVEVLIVTFEEAIHPLRRFDTSPSLTAPSRPTLEVRYGYR